MQNHYDNIIDDLITKPIDMSNINDKYIYFISANTFGSASFITKGKFVKHTLDTINKIPANKKFNYNIYEIKNDLVNNLIDNKFLPEEYRI